MRMPPAQQSFQVSRLIACPGGLVMLPTRSEVYYVCRVSLGDGDPSVGCAYLKLRVAPG